MCRGCNIPDSNQPLSTPSSFLAIGNVNNQFIGNLHFPTPQKLDYKAPKP